MSPCSICMLRTGTVIPVIHDHSRQYASPTMYGLGRSTSSRKLANALLQMPCDIDAPSFRLLKHNRRLQLPSDIRRKLIARASRKNVAVVSEAMYDEV